MKAGQAFGLGLAKPRIIGNFYTRLLFFYLHASRYLIRYIHKREMVMNEATKNRMTITSRAAYTQLKAKCGLPETLDTYTEGHLTVNGRECGIVNVIFRDSNHVVVKILLVTNDYTVLQSVIWVGKNKTVINGHDICKVSGALQKMRACT